MKQRMNEGCKNSIDVLNDILSQQIFPCDKSRIGYCIIQKPKSRTLKLSQEEAEEKATNSNHGNGSNERKYHIQQIHGFKNPMPQGRSFNSNIQVLFMAIAFHVMNLITKPWSADIMQKERLEISTTQLEARDATMLVTLLHIATP